MQELYRKTANIFQAHAFFYHSHPSVVNKHAPVDNVPALFVYKENLHYNFSGESIERKWNDHCYSVLYQMFNSTCRTQFERHGTNERDALQVGERGTFSNIPESNRRKHKSIILNK